MTITHTQPAPTFEDVWRMFQETDRQMKERAAEFERDKNHQALGAVAAMVMSDAVKDYALAHGLYVLRQNGDSIEIGNPDGFTPTVW